MSIAVPVILSDKLSNGNHRIYLRLTLPGRRPKYKKTILDCPKEKFDKKRNRLIGEDPLTQKLNNYLTKLCNQILEVIIEEDNITKSEEAIFDMASPKSESLYFYAELFLKKREEKSQFDSVQIYTHHINQMKKYKAEALVSDINEVWISHFVKLISVACNRNTIARKLTFWSGVFTLVIKDKRNTITINPFSEYDYQGSKPKIKEIPTAQDITLLINGFKNLPPKQKLAVGVYLTQYFTRGTRISDITLLKNVNIFSNYIQIKELKTNEYKRFGLHPVVKHILSQYITSEYAFPLFNWKTNPSLSDKENAKEKKKEIDRCRAKINKNLAAACKKVGITKHLTSHSARHGFATMGITAVDGDLRRLQGALNHKNFTTTEGYVHELERADHTQLENLVYAEFEEATKKLVG